MARFLRFNVVGAAGIIVQVVALWMLTDVFQINALIATPIAVVVAVVHNFWWHRRWTWRDRVNGDSPLPAFARFAAANGIVSLTGNWVIVAALMATSPHLPPTVANLIAIAACGIANYGLADAVVFHRRTALS